MMAFVAEAAHRAFAPDQGEKARDRDLVNVPRLVEIGKSDVDEGKPQLAVKRRERPVDVHDDDRRHCHVGQE